MTRALRITIACAGALGPAALATAQSSIDETNKWSWGENIGWMNWRDANDAEDGVRNANGLLYGFVWSESTGWINVGSPGFSNPAAGEFGLRVDPLSGRITGYAWGENIGWIQFTLSDLDADLKPRLDPATSRLQGFAWSENAGWINLSTTDVFVEFVSCPEDLTGDGIVNAADLATLLGDWGDFGANGPADFDDSGSVDSSDLATLLGSWGPCI